MKPLQRECLAAVIILGLLPVSAYGGGLTSPYTDPQYQTKVPFGQHSHYIQPWRATLETVSAKQFLNALGVGLDVQNKPHMDLDGDDPASVPALGRAPADFAERQQRRSLPVQALRPSRHRRRQKRRPDGYFGKG